MRTDVKALLGDLGVSDFPYRECRRIDRARRATSRWGLLVAARDAVLAAREGRAPHPIDSPLLMEPQSTDAAAAALARSPETPAPGGPEPVRPPAAPTPVRTGRSLLDSTRTYAAFGPRAEGGRA